MEQVESSLRHMPLPTWRNGIPHLRTEFSKEILTSGKLVDMKEAFLLSDRVPCASPTQRMFEGKIPSIRLGQLTFEGLFFRFNGLSFAVTSQGREVMADLPRGHATGMRTATHLGDELQKSPSTSPPNPKPTRNGRPVTAAERINGLAWLG